MSIFKGEKLVVEIYGTSHAQKIGAKASGFPRLKIDEENLKNLLKRRSPSSSVFSTKRKEPDEPIFEKGVNNGVIDGDFEVVIYNKDVKSSDYNELYARPRPSHADLVRYFRSGEKDYRGGGEFSARMTAPLCAVGALCKQYLFENYGVEILAYLSSVGKVDGASYKTHSICKEEIKACHQGFPSLTNGEKMIEEISKAQSDGDSVGGVVECVAFNVPKGVGGSLFEGLEGKISNLVYAIPAVKGIEFGDGFDLSKMLGSVANDPIRLENGKIVVEKNSAGGINGGISNGNPLTMRVGFRPTPSISKEQRTVDVEKMENVNIKIKGRHDSCVAVRAVPIVECAVAIALLDCILKEKN
ncbi:MAG: chorismate synthase [Clostridia bacterium]|nr:chorismate synthase [Clostridia bacterium]